MTPPDSQLDINREIADMRAAGVAPEAIMRVYTTAAERWEALAGIHEKKGSKAQQAGCLAIAVELRRVALLAAKLEQERTPITPESICASSFAVPA